MHRLLPVAALVVFAAAMWALHREIEHFNFSDFRAYLHQISLEQLGVAACSTIVGYLALICYDWFALRYVRQKVANWQIALTAFIGYAFSMNIGHSVISGGAVRMRLYTSWGIDAADVTRVIGFNFVIGILGQILAGGLLFSLTEFSIPASLEFPFHSVRGLGIFLLFVVAAFLVLISLRREAIQVRNWRFELPTFRLTLPAIMVSSVDWLLSGVVLFALMPPDMGLTLWYFLGIVSLAQAIALLSLVPGGLGVFETIILHLLPESV
ncbi:MAG: UPF0104 family protein [Verrucomicrobiae bacterium]|nr:UPF0104 family protein [Verrucomicrobiae bacterium]